MTDGPMVITNQTFENMRINLDGTIFNRCLFKECRLFFTGADPVSFDECTFVRCDWVFDGPAQNTLSFMSALYRELGPPGQELIGMIFSRIKDGSVGQDSPDVSAPQVPVAPR